MSSPRPVRMAVVRDGLLGRVAVPKESGVQKPRPCWTCQVYHATCPARNSAILKAALRSATSERDGAFYHVALYLSTVPDIGCWEVVVVLNHVLSLEEYGRCDEPATAELRTIDADIVWHAEEATLHVVVASADIELVVHEAIQALANVLIPCAVNGLSCTATLRLLQVSEEFETVVLHKRVEHECCNLTAEFRLNGAGPGVRIFCRGGVLHHVVIARACPIAAVQGVVHRAGGGVNGAGQTNPEITLQLLVETKLAEECWGPFLRLSYLAVNLATGHACHCNEAICTYIGLATNLSGECVHDEITDNRVVHRQTVVCAAIMLIAVVDFEVANLQGQVFHDGVERVHVDRRRVNQQVAVLDPGILVVARRQVGCDFNAYSLCELGVEIQICNGVIEAVTDLDQLVRVDTIHQLG